MFSMLVFMFRDPGNTTIEVSCCVELSYCFKNGDFYVGAKVPRHPIENELDPKTKPRQIFKVPLSS